MSKFAGKALSLAAGSISKIIGKQIGLIVGMGFLAMLTSFMFLILLQKFPRVILSMALIIFCLVLLFNVFFCVWRQLYMAAFFSGLFFALYVCFLYSFRNKFEAALVIMRFTS